MDGIVYLHPHEAKPPHSPFAVRNFAMLACAVGFTMRLYRDNRTILSDMAEPGYFDQAQDMLRAGDMIVIIGADGSTIRSVVCTGPHVVTEALQ